MSDYIIRAITRDGLIRASAVSSRETVESARKIHKTLPLATAALGRALSAASMMGSMLKNPGASLTVQIKGDGPLGTVVAVSDSAGSVRGYLQNPLADLQLSPNGKLDVGGGIGKNGFLSVIKDDGSGKFFSGHVKLINGEVAEDLTAYFAQSEQIPACCALGVLIDVDYSVKSAGGFIIELLPGAGDDAADRLERSIQSLPPTTSMLAGGVCIEEILEKALSGFELIFFEKTEIGYKCACSEKKVRTTLVSLGENELKELLKEQNTTVTCQFCDKVYSFTRDQIRDIYNQAKLIKRA